MTQIGMLLGPDIKHRHIASLEIAYTPQQDQFIVINISKCIYYLYISNVYVYWCKRNKSKVFLVALKQAIITLKSKKMNFVP